MGKKVGLVMIVKNEESIIERALLSAIPFITNYVIVDTGSTDKTKEIITRILKDISGIIYDRPWVDFGTNRTEALALCKNHMDWAIMLDADDNLAGEVPPPELWALQQVDGFSLRIQHGVIWHQRVQIFRTSADWIYEGVIHEAPRCTSKVNPVIAQLPATTFMMTRCEGFRSRDPYKYIKDAALLENQLVTKPNDSRTIFYLAQSYRDAGCAKEAITYYRRYLDLSGCWIQESYMVLVNLINLVTDESEKIELTWRAIDLCPDRVEAPFTLLQGRRLRGLPATQQMFAIATAVKNRKSNDSFLFVNPDIYSWGMDDELAVVAFATKHYREAYEAATRCIIGTEVPSLRENAIKNAQEAQRAMLL